MRRFLTLSIMILNFLSAVAGKLPHAEEEWNTPTQPLPATVEIAPQSEGDRLRAAWREHVRRQRELWRGQAIQLIEQHPELSLEYPSTTASEAVATE